MEQPILRRSRESKLRALGLLPAGWVCPDSARAHALWLHDEQGMSYLQISRQAGVGQATVSDLVKGKRSNGDIIKVMRWDISEALLGVKPAERPPGERGARILAVGSQRRIRALVAAGFSFQFQGRYLGYKSETTRNYGTALLKNRYIHQDLAERVDAMYRTLRYEDPMMWGMTLNAMNRVQNDGVRKSYAPPSCWDDDTIDRLDAFPEWTGACGSMEGLRIHRRDDTPVCEPCQNSRRVAKTARLASADSAAREEARNDG